MLRVPMIVVNFKLHQDTQGQGAVKLAEQCRVVAEGTGIEIAVAVSAADVHLVSSQVDIPVLAQHCDPFAHGSHTGRISASSLKDNGAAGTLLNHSENHVSLDELEKAIGRCRLNGLFTLVCADNPQQAEAVSFLKPDIIAMEPPELIGSDVSVSTGDPQSIEKTVKKVKHHEKCGVILVGAGVKTGEDVASSIRLGTQGVLVASGVTKAHNPQQALRDLASGMKFS